MCRSYYIAAQPASKNDVTIFKVLLSISLGMTTRLGSFVADIKLIDINEQSEQVQYLRQHTVRCSDVLMISKLEDFCGPPKVPNWRRHHNDRKYYRRAKLLG